MSTNPYPGVVFAEKLREDVALTREAGNLVFRRRGFGDLTLPDTPAFRLVAERLAAGWLDEAALDVLAAESGDMASAYFTAGYLRKAVLLQMRCRLGDRSLFTLIPAPELSLLVCPEIGDWRLSRFACLHREGADLILEMPGSRTRCAIGDAASLDGFLAAVEPATPAADAAHRLFCAALHFMNALERTDGKNVADETWQFHDLFFHHRSMSGYHDAPSGATWRLKGVLPAAPLFKPVTGACQELPEPDEELAARLRRPFSEVASTRRSARPDSKRQVTRREIAALLGAAARVQKILDDPGHPCPGTLRPSPSGGALYSLEIYLLVQECDGLEAGAYRYEPERHRLECVPVEKTALADYLGLNPFSRTPGAGLPQVQLVITSRFLRLSWKYESGAYRFALLELGALYQSIGLAATALGLASCILGGIDAPRVAELLHLDPLAEPPLGGMTLSAP